MIEIVQYFGVSLDVLVFFDLENGNLIEETDIQKFKQNGNLIGNPIGNLKGAYLVTSPAKGQLETGAKDADGVKEWASIQLLKQIDQKLDGVRALLEKKPKR